MTKEYIIKTCEKYGIENYTINNDLSIDVNGHVNLSFEGLTELPLVFNIVEGDLFCHYNKLTSLKGAPRKCRYFYCYNNNLTSLEGAPDECEIFSCSDNNLTTLKGAPKCNSIRADYNKLNLDNEDLYVIEALVRYYDGDDDLDNYYNIRLKIERRNELINTILD